MRTMSYAEVMEWSIEDLRERVWARGVGEVGDVEDSGEADCSVEDGSMMSFRTAMVRDAIPTSSRTGWLVKAPIRALQPAPCVTRMRTVSASSSSCSADEDERP